MKITSPKHLLFLTAFLLACWTVFQACQSNSNSTVKTDPNQPQEKIDYYQNKQVKREASVVNGQKQGTMVDYYPDGKVKGKRNFKNDIQDGRTTWYFPNGKIKEVQYFVNGLKQGGDTLWYDTGELQFTVDFVDSKKNGYFRKWAKDGTIAIEAIYKQDSLVKVTQGKFHAGQAMEVDPTLKPRPATLEDASGG